MPSMCMGNIPFFRVDSDMCSWDGNGNDNGWHSQFTAEANKPELLRNLLVVIVAKPTNGYEEREREKKSTKVTIFVESFGASVHELWSTKYTHIIADLLLYVFMCLDIPFLPSIFKNGNSLETCGHDICKWTRTWYFQKRTCIFSFTFHFITYINTFRMSCSSGCVEGGNGGLTRENYRLL